MSAGYNPELQIGYEDWLTVDSQLITTLQLDAVDVQTGQPMRHHITYGLIDNVQHVLYRVHA